MTSQPVNALSPMEDVNLAVTQPCLNSLAQTTEPTGAQKEWKKLASTVKTVGKFKHASKKKKKQKKSITKTPLQNVSPLTSSFGRGSIPGSHFVGRKKKIVSSNETSPGMTLGTLSVANAQFTRPAPVSEYQDQYQRPGSLGKSHSFASNELKEAAASLGYGKQHPLYKEYLYHKAPGHDCHTHATVTAFQKHDEEPDLIHAALGYGENHPRYKELISRLSSGTL